DILNASLVRAEDDPALLTRLASGYASVGKTDEAMALLTEVLKASPADAKAYILMGLIEEESGQPETAEDAFRQAVAVDPSDPGSHEALVGFLMRQGRLDDAEIAVREGLGENGESVGLRIQFAMLLERNGHIEAAIAEYEALLAINPKSSLIANNLAVNLSKNSDDPEKLDRAYTIAARFRTSHIPHFVDTLGWIEFLRGHHESALPLLRNAAGQLSDVAQVQFHYGMVLKALGQNDQATEVLMRAVALAPPRSPLADRAGQALDELSSDSETAARVPDVVQTEIVSQAPRLSSGHNEPGL
ncbi:MAG: tetratricopeptide repeat protein, partial [bacterium]|nr:tetratricopeptide repeat protein [bacterium]